MKEFETLFNKVIDPPKKKINEAANEELLSALQDDVFVNGKDRYTVTISFYMYADDDEHVKKQANKLVEDLNSTFDARAIVDGIEETPFASLSSRKVQ